MRNYMKLEIPSKSLNEAFARAAVGAFAAQADPTVEELADIKTSVSEAVTNSIIHGYRDTVGVIYIECEARVGKTCVIEIIVRDEGVGIPDVERAMEPLFTTAPDEERSGMGFTVMQSFMDTLDVISEKGKGTTVKMSKKINAGISDDGY